MATKYAFPPTAATPVPGAELTAASRTVPAGVPSVENRTSAGTASPGLWTVAVNSKRLPRSWNCRGPLDSAPGARSASRRVPAAVPSLTHGSAPVARSAWGNTNFPFTAATGRAAGNSASSGSGRPTLVTCGVTSATRVVPPAVPSDRHRPLTPAASVAVK